MFAGNINWIDDLGGLMSHAVLHDEMTTTGLSGTGQQWGQIQGPRALLLGWWEE